MKGKKLFQKEDTVAKHIRDRKPGDIYIGRPSPWGNPFRIGRNGTREHAITAFRFWALYSQEPRARWIRAHVHELKGKNLICFCAPLPCHGDILAHIAESI